jgi:hypothetical protein
MAHTNATKDRTATDVNARMIAVDSSGASNNVEFDRRKFELDRCLKTLVTWIQSLDDVPGRTNDFLQESKQKRHKGRNEVTSERTVPPQRTPI